MQPPETEADFPNIRHMAIVCAAIDMRSVSRAAAALNITQPAASQGIANLERSLSAPLILRQTSGIAPTAAGTLFANRAGRALETLHDAARLAQRAAGAGRDRDDRLSTKFSAAQLRALIAVGNTGSFTLAAHELGLRQPTVHRAARQFEALCAFAVFRSTRGKVELTPAGHILLQAAKLARGELRQAREELAALRGDGKSTFVLGSMPLARSEIIPRAIDSILALDDGIQVQVIDGRYAELLRGLREGDIDCLIGALRQPAPANDVTEAPLFDDELAVVCRPGHPLTALARPGWDDTRAFPWIAPPIATPAGRFLADMFGLDGLKPSPVRVVSSSLVLVRGLLTHGDYLTVISRHQIEGEVGSGVFVQLPIRLKGHIRAIGLTTRRSWRPTAAQAAFTRCLRAAAPAPADAGTSLTL